MEKVLFVWNENYETGYKSIDNQHKYLVDIINNLYNNILTSQNFDIKNSIDKLISYANEHFEYEENLFEIYNYTESKEHAIEHRSFVDKIMDFYEKADKADFKLPLEMMNYLRSWLIKHILYTDKKYIGKIG